MPQKTSPQPATIDDVARLAGVSSATVSRVINQSAPVIPETLQKVQEAIEALHYMPSSAAQHLAGKKTSTLGFVVPEISEVFFLPLLRGIEEAASQAGYNLLIHTTRHKSGEERYKTLGKHNTDGLLVFSDSVDDRELARLDQSGFPAVLIYRDTPAGLSMPCVTIDNKNGACTIVEHLIQVHHRKRIVFLRGPQGVNDAEWREKGYRKALADNGLPIDETLIAAGDFKSAVAHDSILNLLRRGIAFDAVFSADDGSAFGALAALREAGLRVPEDVSLAGFDDVEFAAHTLPSLTTVYAPTEEVGRNAVQQLIHLIHHEPAQSISLLPTQAVIRQSCGCNEPRQSIKRKTL